MTSVLKSLFTFNNPKERDQEINTKLSRIESLIKDLDKQKQADLPIKIKAILNAAFFEERGESLFELVYKSACHFSPVEWVPSIGKAVSLFSCNSAFMKVVLQVQDYKIPVEKNFIPHYLFRQNLLNENTGYQGISNSVSGLTAPVLDYVFLRLLHGLQELEFIPLVKEYNSEYESDDIFLHLSRNPYLLLLRNYLAHLVHSQRQLARLAASIKMFFVDELILKHRINKSSSYLKETLIFSSLRKVKPQNLLTVYLLLHQGRALFEEKHMFFYELITRFGSLIEADSEVFFRFFFRIFLFAYSKSSTEIRLIDRLEGANEKDGVFDVERYSIKEYQSSIRACDANEKKQFNDSKAILLKLLEKDYNLNQNGRVHFSLIRTLGCFLALQLSINQASRSGSRNMDSADLLRMNSEAGSLQIAIEKVCLQAVVMKHKDTKPEKKLNKSNQAKLDQQIQEINQLFLETYKRRIDMSKFQSQKETKSAAEVGIRGNSQDFTFSVETYRRDIEVNCWNVPLKDSEYLILYELFYAIAKGLHRLNPWAKQGSEPTINLRYFCNPFVFMVSVLLLIMFLKILF